MAAKQYPQEEYRIVLGEKRDGMNYTARTYFFHAAPTGLEQGLSRCPFIRILSSHGGNEQPNGSRVTEMTFTVSQPLSIKMVCMHTGFGLPANRKYLYLDLEPEAERIEITGLGGFGTFIGRAKINAEKSEMTMAMIKENFSISVLASPRTETNKDVRSIIY